MTESSPPYVTPHNERAAKLAAELEAVTATEQSAVEKATAQIARTRTESAAARSALTAAHEAATTQAAIKCDKTAHSQLKRAAAEFVVEASRSTALELARVFRKLHDDKIAEVGAEHGVGAASCGLGRHLWFALAALYLDKDPGALTCFATNAYSENESRLIETANKACLTDDASTIVEALEALERAVASHAQGNRAPRATAQARWDLVRFGGKRKSITAGLAALDKAETDADIAQTAAHMAKIHAADRNGKPRPSRAEALLDLLVPPIAGSNEGTRLGPQ